MNISIHSPNQTKFVFSVYLLVLVFLNKIQETIYGTFGGSVLKTVCVRKIYKYVYVYNCIQNARFAVN